MIIYNVQILTEERKFVPGAVVTEGKNIKEIKNISEISEKMLSAYAETAEILDGKGAYCLPGMIDIHFHGCKGYDFCDGTREALHKIAKYQLSIGVAAIVPATMTLAAEQLERILKNGAAYRREQIEREKKGETAAEADLVGVNMEGPFISPVKKGAQDARYILPCNKELYRRFQTAADGMIKFIGIAPEETSWEQTKDFIRNVKKETVVSLAHTNADYDTAKRAFDAGANHLVHMYNAMPPFSHRAPGVIGAAADSGTVTAEIICDGVHIHPSAVRGAFALMGEERISFISDSMRAAGMSDGSYTLGGQEVEVKGNKAVLAADGSLAGSVTSLPDCVRIAVKEMGIPLEKAAACASINPAKSIGLDQKYGSVSPGKRANLVLWDRDLKLQKVIKNGKIITED